MTDPITSDILVTITCAGVVAMYSAKRYNTPETNRVSTTQVRFLFTCAGYVVASLALFLLLCEIVLKPGMLPLLQLEHAQKVVSRFAAPPVLAAVLLTTLLPNVLVINTADAWILKRFQAWGRIPQGVRDLADAITPEALPVVELDLTALRDWINSDGDIPNDLANRMSLEAAETASGRFTRVIHLYRELEKLKALPAYAEVFRDSKEDWQAIRSNLRIFAAQSQAFFVLFDQLANLVGTAAADALEQSRDRYREICQTLQAQMAELVARSLLRVERSDVRIRNRLKSIGYHIAEPPSPPSPLPIGELLFLGVMMVVVSLLAVAIVQPASFDLPLGVIAVLIGATRTIGVLAAILPKLRWSAFQPDSRGNLPYLGWLASSTLGGLISFLIERTALSIAHHTFAVELDFNQCPLSPMAPMAFVISLSIAALCDVNLHLADDRVRRLTEGMLCATASVTGMFICTQLLNMTPATVERAPSWYPFVFSFVLGLAIGCVGPHIYRRSRGKSSEADVDVSQFPPNSRSSLISVA